jgi:hypothetical protein
VRGFLFDFADRLRRFIEAAFSFVFFEGHRKTILTMETVRHEKNHAIESSNSQLVSYSPKGEGRPI